MSDTVQPLIRLKKGCAICGKPTVEKYLPFCSKRCADVDLSRWLTGVYAIPANEDEEKRSPTTIDEQ